MSNLMNKTDLFMTIIKLNQFINYKLLFNYINVTSHTNIHINFVIPLILFNINFE